MSHLKINSRKVFSTEFYQLIDRCLIDETFPATVV